MSGRATRGRDFGSRVAERAAARNQLAELGVNPSPADVSAWMAMDSKTQRRMALQYVILAIGSRIDRPLRRTTWPLQVRLLSGTAG